MSTTSTIVVETVQTRRDYETFVDLPWQVPMDRAGVRPMREFERHLFDKGRRFRGSMSPQAMIDVMLLGQENPFYEHGELEMFLAKDETGKAVARIVAIHNRLHNDFHQDKTGFFGFYQCVDGGEVGREATRALVEAASDWLRARGLDSIRGPFNPTINDDCGIWLDGDSYPSFLMPSNPRYYADLLEAASMVRAKTLRVYRIDLQKDLSDAKWARWLKMTQRLERAYPNIHIRTADFKNLKVEVESFVDIFNLAWSKNWGFAPMSFKELMAMAELFQYMVDPNLIRAAEIEENGVRKTVGVMITIPDLNEFLRFSNGALLSPVLMWKVLRMKMSKKPTHRIRVAILGVLPDYRHTPVSIGLLVDSFKVAKAFGAKEIEASWILEDNVPMVQPLEHQGFSITDHYGIYERAV
jgi:hypothetical protein